MTRRKHPTTVIAHTYRPRQFYEPIAAAAEEYWEELLPKLGDGGIKILLAAHGRSVARAARLQDKLNTFKQIISAAQGVEGGSISDEDALAVLAGWTVHNVVREEQ